MIVLWDWSYCDEIFYLADHWLWSILMLFAAYGSASTCSLLIVMNLLVILVPTKVLSSNSKIEPNFTTTCRLWISLPRSLARIPSHWSRPWLKWNIKSVFSIYEYILSLFIHKEVRHGVYRVSVMPTNTKVKIKLLHIYTASAQLMLEIS